MKLKKKLKKDKNRRENRIIEKKRRGEERRNERESRSKSIIGTRGENREERTLNIRREEDSREERRGETRDESPLNSTPGLGNFVGHCCHVPCAGEAEDHLHTRDKGQVSVC